MKSPKKSGDNGRWERTLARFFTANRIPLRWDGVAKRFVGISSYTFARIAPMRARVNPDEALSNLPRYFREHQHDGNLIVVVTNLKYGDDLEDSLVVMKLGTFAPIFTSHINTDRERYVYAADHHR